MPLLTRTSYRSPFIKNGHYQTIVPALFRRVRKPSYSRERLNTPDDDFIHIDWLRNSVIGSNPPLVILSHGLEGDTSSRYIRGMASHFYRNGYDVLARNQRNCSGEPNLKLQSYHSGAIEDLDLCVQTAIERGYTRIMLIGFSLGGNQTLLYASGERLKPPHEVIGALAFSTPVDLKACAERLALPSGRIYMKQFLDSMRKRLLYKAKQFPGEIDLNGLEKIRTFREWDDRYTGPIHGFKDAEDYWARCSSVFVLSSIRIPSLLIQSRNDPFLTDECFPRLIAGRSRFLHLEDLQYGGHCGYAGGDRVYWSEHRALQFSNSVIAGYV